MNFLLNYTLGAVFWTAICLIAYYIAKRTVVDH